MGARHKRGAHDCATHISRPWAETFKRRIPHGRMKNTASTTTTSSAPNNQKQKLPDWPAINLRAATDYATDFWQRTALFLDILRQSGNQQEEMTSRPVNAVLIFEHEIILKGTELPRPVNYALVRVEPPPGTAIDETKRPVVV